MTRAIPFASYLAVPQPRWNDRTHSWEPYAPAGVPLSLVERTVLAMYVDKHRQGNDVIAIVATDLMMVTGAKRRAVEYARAALVDQGLLVVVAQSTGGRGKPTSYRLGERLLHSFRNPAPRAQFSEAPPEAKPRTTCAVSEQESTPVKSTEPRTTCAVSEVDESAQVEEKPRTTCGDGGEKPRTETPHPDPINPAPGAPSIERDPRARTRTREAGLLVVASRSGEAGALADAPPPTEQSGSARQETELQPTQRRRIGNGW